MTADRIRGWLEEAGSRRVRVSGTNLVGSCPFHHDQHPSFAMSAETGLFVCYSGGCGERGNLAQFLMRALNWAPRKAIETAADVVGDGARRRERAPLPEWSKRRGAVAGSVSPNLLLEAQNDVYLEAGFPTYMTGRGFTDATLDRWGIGYDEVSRRVTIPVRTFSGTLVGVSKRATKETQSPPYLHDGFSKGQYLYGINLWSMPEEVWVCEGQLDAMALDQMFDGAEGFGVAATMGSLVTKVQIDGLARVNRLVLAFDADEAGRKATELDRKSVV